MHAGVALPKLSAGSAPTVRGLLSGETPDDLSRPDAILLSMEKGYSQYGRQEVRDLS